MRLTWFERWKILYARWIKEIKWRATHPIDDPFVKQLKRDLGFPLRRLKKKRGDRE